MDQGYRWSSCAKRRAPGKAGRQRPPFLTFLYWVLVLASSAGVIFPLLRLLERYGPALTDLLAYLQTHPALWNEFDTRYVIVNAAAVIALFLFHQRIKLWLIPLLAWRANADHRYARNVIFLAVVATIAGYQSRAHLGFWYFGIPGWTYHNKTIPDISTRPFVEPNEQPIPSFFAQGVLKNNAAYLWKSGYLRGWATFLHYRDGTVHIANDDLLGIVFPEYAVGNSGARRPEIFAKIVRHSLETRRAGRRFLLPLSIAYPNHAPYMPLDYTDTPPSSTLEKLTRWRITIHVDDQRRVTVVGARKHFEITRS